MRDNWDEEVLEKESSLPKAPLSQDRSPCGTPSRVHPARRGNPTCVAHEVVVRGVEEAMEATGVIPWSRITAELVFWGWIGIAAEVSCLKGGFRLHAGITTRLDL